MVLPCAYVSLMLCLLTWYSQISGRALLRRLVLRHERRVLQHYTATISPHYRCLIANTSFSLLDHARGELHLTTPPALTAPALSFGLTPACP